MSIVLRERETVMLRNRTTSRWSVTAALSMCLLAGMASAQTGTLFVEGNNVGIGIAAPQADLDIQNLNAATNVVRLRSAAGHDVFRIFETGNGDGLISLYNENGGETFRFTSVSGGRLAIGCSSNLSHDLELNDGSASLACGAGTFSRANAGQTQFTTSSSRTIKQNLEPIPAEGILDKISAVAVYNYDFIDGPQDRIGWMAEDFHQVFERGAATELNGHDVQVALWLAVQELTARTDELARRNEELASENEELKREVARFGR
jgi:hypothetical protein